MGAPHAIAPGEIVVTNANLEFKNVWAIRDGP